MKYSTYFSFTTLGYLSSALPAVVNARVGGGSEEVQDASVAGTSEDLSRRELQSSGGVCDGTKFTPDPNKYYTIEIPEGRMWTAGGFGRDTPDSGPNTPGEKIGLRSNNRDAAAHWRFQDDGDGQMIAFNR